MTQQLHSYSGQNYDRWVQRNSSTTTLGKVQKQFWFTKSAVIRRLGKKEDEHVVASDAELDAKIELFRAIEASTKNLQVLLADYQNKICIMAQEENALGRLLKEQGKVDRTRAGKVMAAAGKSLSYTAQQRVALRNPLVRLFQEVDTFYSRAVEDTAATVVEMEKVRTEYRGALMWMKNVSQDFNPDQHSQLEKFREVQATVKLKKAKFDRMKLKSLQKIDLLAASRCNMFSHALIVYQNGLVAFSEKAARTMNNVATSFKGHQPYQFTVIRELADLPLDDDAEAGRDDGEEAQADGEGEGEKMDNDEKTFFNAEYHDQPRKAKDGAPAPGGKKAKARKAEAKKTPSDSLVNLLEYDGSGESGGEGIDAPSSQLVDLLGPEMELPRTESETQQLLRELFESPVRQPLPVFGSSDVAATPSKTTATTTTTTSGLPQDPSDPFSLPLGPQTQPGQPPQNMFLPSQLLDFGLQGWQPPTTPNTATQATPSPSGAARPTTTATSSSSLKEEVQKLDWYKVFQDIDPLADPANALFSPAAEEGKQC